MEYYNYVFVDVCPTRLNQKVPSKKKNLAIVLALGAYCRYRTQMESQASRGSTFPMERVELTCPTLRSQAIRAARQDSWMSSWYKSNPADTILKVEAFRVAGLTSGLHCVSEGGDALAYVRREGVYAKEAIPDRIFLDLSQPRVSGLEVLKILKSTPSLMHIPIVVAAGSAEPDFVRKVYCAERKLLHAKTG
jgi:CheY-like chemotaxis protein